MEKSEIEKEKERRMQIAKKFADKVLEKYGNLVKAIVMMGSVVRGEFKPKSDIDIFLILDDTVHKFDSKELDKIDMELEEIAKGIPEAKIKIKNPETGKEEENYSMEIQQAMVQSRSFVQKKYSSLLCDVQDFHHRVVWNFSEVLGFRYLDHFPDY